MISAAVFQRLPLYLVGALAALLTGCPNPDTTPAEADASDRSDARPGTPDAERPPVVDADPARPDATPVETPDGALVETPDAAPAETPDATPTETPDAAPAAETPDATPTAETPDAAPGEAPDAAPAGTPDAAPTTTPDATTPDAMPTEPTVELAVCAIGAPYTTLSAAIAAAPPGATLLLCAGTYHETLIIAAKSLRVLGVDGAAVTIIDGDAASRVFSVQGTGGAGVTLEGLTITNGLSAFEGGGVRCEASTLHLLDSVVIGNAGHNGGGLYATGCVLDIARTRFEQNDGDEQGGGAMLVDSSGELRDSVFLANLGVDGGGLTVTEGTVAILDNHFEGNFAALRGGALYHDSDSLVAGNTMLDNDAGWTGGGIHVVAHAPTLSNNTVSGNTSVNDGGGIYVHMSTALLLANHVIQNSSGDDGGGIRLFECAAYLEANLVEENHSDDGGGGIRVSHVPSLLVDNIVRNNTAINSGGGLDLDNDSSTVRGGEISGNTAAKGAGIFAWLGPWTGHKFENILISDNHAWKGGGIFLDDEFQPVTMRGLTIVGNTADKGAGLYVRATTFTLSHSVFEGNDANHQGGALYVGVNSSWWEPCPCPPLAPIGTVEFVVFHGNVADEGSAVWTDSPGLSVASSILFGNSDLAVTVAAPVLTPDVVVPPAWRYNDTFPATFSGMADPTGSDGNLATDPLFASIVSGDFHLLAASACIDAGDPVELDLDGTRADMGAFGGTP